MLVVGEHVCKNNAPQVEMTLIMIGCVLGGNYHITEQWKQASAAALPIVYPTGGRTKWGTTRTECRQIEGGRLERYKDINDNARYSESCLK